LSLFDNNAYQYRDTFFVFFPIGKRPDAEIVRASLENLREGFNISSIRVEGLLLESIAIECPDDNSGMDVAIVQGDEVRQQVGDLLKEFKTITLVDEDRLRLELLRKCDGRFDILHFGRLDSGEDIDPGGLLLVIQQLSELTGGVGLDPQSMSLI